MAAFFSNRRGYIVPVRIAGGVNPSPIAIRMQDMRLGSQDDPTARTIITQFVINYEGNFQVLHSVGDAAFVYIFGDRISELRIAGLCFATPCLQPILAVSGMQRVLDAYANNRLAVRPTPIRINLGDTVFRALLTGATLEIVDAERNMGQWNMRFIVFPSGKLRTATPAGNAAAPADAGQPGVGNARLHPPVPIGPAPLVPPEGPGAGVGGVRQWPQVPIGPAPLVPPEPNPSTVPDVTDPGSKPPSPPALVFQQGIAGIGFGTTMSSQYPSIPPVDAQGAN